MLSAKNIVFHRQSFPLLRGTSFQVGAGELMKIVGSNGCGKTTLLKMLASLLPPDEGLIQWDGKDIQQDKLGYCEELLYIGHQNAIDDNLTPLENLQAMAILRLRLPATPLLEALQQAGLAAVCHRPCRALSAGQKRRVTLARLRAFQAKLWLLDEPLAALDVIGREMMSTWSSAHLAVGGIAVVSMHLVDDWSIPTSQVFDCEQERLT